MKTRRRLQAKHRHRLERWRLRQRKRVKGWHLRHDPGEIQFALMFGPRDRIPTPSRAEVFLRIRGVIIKAQAFDFERVINELIRGPGYAVIPLGAELKIIQSKE